MSYDIQTLSFGTGGAPALTDAKPAIIRTDILADGDSTTGGEDGLHFQFKDSGSIVADCTKEGVATFAGVVANTMTPTILNTSEVIETVYQITDGAAFEIDPGNGTIQYITLGANRTPKGTNFAAGQSITLHVNDGTAYTLTWTDTTFGASGVTWVDATAPVLPTSGYAVIVLWKFGSQVYGKHIGDVA